MPPPVPPSVKRGRRITREADLLDGIAARLLDASATMPERGHASPMRAIACLEQLAVLGLLDRVDGRAEQLDAVLLEHAAPSQRHREVERGLAAERRQDRVGLLALEDRRRAPRR